MKEYFENRINLFVLIMLNLFFELALSIYIYRNKEFLMIKLNQTYRGYTRGELADFIIYGTYLNGTFNLFQYMFGIYAIFSNRVTHYQMFNTLILIGMVFRVTLSWLNIMNLFMVILKIFTYIYSRFTISLLLSVLILPQDV